MNLSVVSRTEDEGARPPIGGSGPPPSRTTKLTDRPEQPQHYATDDPPGRSNAVPVTRAVEKLLPEQRQQLSSLWRDLGIAGPWRVGLNDLAEAYRDSSLAFRDFLESLEHLVFYIRSPNGESITSPRGWLMKKLGLGFYDTPAGFVSIAAKKAQRKPCGDSEMLGANQPGSENEPPPGVKEAFEARFLPWEKSQSAEDKAEICARNPATRLFAGAGESSAALGAMPAGLAAYVLRKHFAGVADLQVPFLQIYGEGSV